MGINCRICYFHFQDHCIYCPYVCQEESDLMKRSNEVVGLHRGKAEEKWFNLVHVVLLVLAIKSGSSTEQLQSL